MSLVDEIDEYLAENRIDELRAKLPLLIARHEQKVAHATVERLEDAQ